MITILWGVPPPRARLDSPPIEINAAVAAIEELLQTHDEVAEARVRPSGDNTDVIKIWVDVPAAADAHASAVAIDAAIRKAIPGAGRFAEPASGQSSDGPDCQTDMLLPCSR